MIQVFAIMVIVFVALSIFFIMKIKSTTLKIIKTKELNNEENKLEKNYQFIKGLY
ncbi:MAG TPA: hypothetical protein PLS51_04680 [Flavobacterium sp.]|jgi:hypothetical protein|nr:hypothetical protein [Flavobacterium sp.]HPJ09902.1 hypothetical protein [Flavobacterium sp.]